MPFFCKDLASTVLSGFEDGEHSEMKSQRTLASCSSGMEYEILVFSVKG